MVSSNLTEAIAALCHSLDSILAAVAGRHIPTVPLCPHLSARPLLQVGAFPHLGGRWSEWNGRFRDVVRNFIKVWGAGEGS